MAHASQPVAPIYQPEVAAETIWYAAHHRRRELYVGAPTAIIVPGNKLLPGFGDWYLGRTGYAERDHGERVAFDDRAHASSPELWASKHKGLVTLLAAAASMLIASAPSRPGGVGEARRSRASAKWPMRGG
jgi:hypothetical protein